MRISDWSSDVCSSDLAYRARRPDQGGRLVGTRQQADDGRAFANLREVFLHHIATLDDVFVQDLFGGSQPEHRVGVRVVTELAWHSSFVRTMLVLPSPKELSRFTADYAIIDLLSFRANPERHGYRSEAVVAIDFMNV